MVAILHSNSPESIPCTPKKSNLFQKNHSNLNIDTIKNIDIASSSKSNKCLNSSPSTSSKIYYKNNITDSLVPLLPSSLPSIDNISNYHKYYHNPRFNTISKRHSNIEETSVSKDNILAYPFDTMINEPLSSRSINSSHEKPIDIQSFKDTLDSTIAITPPSTTPSTPTTPSSTSSKDIDPFDESLTSIKNSLESKNKLSLKLKETPTSKTNTPLAFSTPSQYTKNKNCKTATNTTINHPKINRSPSNNINNMQSNITVKTPSSLFDSRFSSKNTIISSIPHCTIKSNNNLYSNQINIFSDHNSISSQFKTLCLQLLKDLQHHPESGPFLTPLENKKEGNDKNRRRKNNKNKKTIVNRKTTLISKITDTSGNIAFNVSKHSSDLCSIQHQLEENNYKNIYSVFFDLQQMLIHCYNNDDHFIHRCGKNIEKYIIEKLENMPKDFINELREQCLQHYQYYRRLALSSSTSYPVLPSFLKVITLPTLLDGDFESEEDWMITEDNLLDESSRREEQIKECKKKEKEKLYLILGKNNISKTIKKSKGKSVVCESNDEQLLPSSSCLFNSNKKSLVLSLSKKRKHNQKEDENKIVRWNIILKKIPHSSSHHIDYFNHVNKKMKTLEYDSSKVSCRGKTFVRHPKNKNWVLQFKRNGQNQSIVFSRNSSYHNYRHSSLSSKPFNFILTLPTEIIKNSPWSNMFNHYTNSTRTINVENKENKLLFNTQTKPKSIILSTENVEGNKLELQNKEINEKENKIEISSLIKEPELDNSLMEITKISDGQEKKELNDVILAERCPSTSSEFNRENLMEKEEMKCTMSCNFLPPTPPSSSPPSSPMNITEEEVEEMEERENEESMALDTKETQNIKEGITNEQKEKDDTMENIIDDIKNTDKESENTGKEESSKKEKKMLLEKEGQDLNLLKWLENNKDSKSLDHDLLLLKKDQQESLTNYLINQQINNIIETQMLIDHLNNVNNTPFSSLSPLYPLNSFDASFDSLPNFSCTNNANLLSSTMLNIDNNLPSTSLNTTTYDTTNDFIDWDKACGDSISNQNIVNPSFLSSIDTTLPFLSDCTNTSLLSNTYSTENITNPYLNLYDDGMFSSLLDLPSTSTNSPVDLSLFDTNNIALNNLTSEEINTIVSSTTATSSSSELAISNIDLNSSLSTTDASLNQNSLAINSIPYPSKLLANPTSIPLMSVKDPLFMGGLNDPATMALHSLPSNLHYSASAYPLRNSRLNGSSSTPPSASSNSIYKHHHHINSSNLYTTASNIATSLTAASKKLSMKSNKNKTSMTSVQQKQSPSKQQKNQIITPSTLDSTVATSEITIPAITSTTTTTCTAPHSPISNSESILSKSESSPVSKTTLNPTTLLNLSSIEGKKEKCEKEILMNEKELSTSPEKTIVEPTLNSLDRITPTIPSKIIADAMPSLPTSNSDIMLSESSEVCKEVQDNLSLLSDTTDIIKNNDSTLPNDLSMTNGEDYLTPPNYSYYDLLLNLNNNCNETLISEMAINETEENIKLNNIKQENTEKETVKTKKENVMNNTIDNATLCKLNNVLEEQSFTIKKENLMDEDIKNNTQEITKVEEVKSKPRRIRISLDLSHSHNKKEDEENEESDEEEEESYMEQDLIEEEEEEEEEENDEMEEDLEFEDENIEENEETDGYESDVKEEESDEFEEEDDDDDDDDDMEIEEDEESEEESEEDDEDDEESNLSLMDIKRIKQQQQNQKETTAVKTNIKINPPIPRIIVHTKRSTKVEPENHEYIDVQQLKLEDNLENIFDIDSITPEVLSKLRKSILSKPKESKKIMRSLVASSALTNNTTKKKERIVNLSKLVLKENKERKIEKKPVVVTRTKKMRGRNVVKVPVLTETNPNKVSNVNITNNVNTTRGKGRPKGHCGRPRKRWPVEPPQIPLPLESDKNEIYNADKENRENKFMVEENGNTLYIRPEVQEKSPETIITQVSVTTSTSVEPITVITSTVPSSIITSTRNSHFYSSSPKQCTYCGSTSTPLWRHGPPESPRLCNSCGVKWKRGKILQSQPSGFPWNSISVDKKTEEFRSLMRCITSDKVLKVLGILKTCMTIAMKRQLDRGEEVKIDIRSIDSRAWSQLYRYIKCQ